MLLKGFRRPASYAVLRFPQPAIATWRRPESIVRLSYYEWAVLSAVRDVPRGTHEMI